MSMQLSPAVSNSIIWAIQTSFWHQLPTDRMTIDGVLDWQLGLLNNVTARYYISQIAITHRLVFSVALLGSGFKHQHCCVHGLILLQVDGHLTPTSYSSYRLQLVTPRLDWTSDCTENTASNSTPLLSVYVTQRQFWYCCVHTAVT
jgi:hypothetical protein